MLHNIDQEGSKSVEDAFRSYQLLFAKYIYESGTQQYVQQRFRQEYKAILGEELLGQAETPVIESFETDCQHYRSIYIDELYGAGRVNKARLLDEQQQLRLGDAVIKQLGKVVRQEFHYACDVYRDLYASDLRDDGQLDDDALVVEQKRLGLGRSIVEAIASTEKSTFATDTKDYRQLVTQTIHQTGKLESDAERSLRIQFSFGPVLLEQIHREVNQEFRGHRATYEQQFLEMLRHNGAITQPEQQKLHDLRQTLGNLNARLFIEFEQSAIHTHEQNVVTYAEEARQVIEQFTTGNIAEATDEERESLQALSHWYNLSPAIAAQIEQAIRTELSAEGQTQTASDQPLIDPHESQATTEGIESQQIETSVVQDATLDGATGEANIEETNIEASNVGLESGSGLESSVTDTVDLDATPAIAASELDETDETTIAAIDPVLPELLVQPEAESLAEPLAETTSDATQDSEHHDHQLLTPVANTEVESLPSQPELESTPAITDSVEPENSSAGMAWDDATPGSITPDDTSPVQVSPDNITTDDIAGLESMVASMENPEAEPEPFSAASLVGEEMANGADVETDESPNTSGDRPIAANAQELQKAGKRKSSSRLLVWGTGLVAGVVLIGGAIASSRNQQPQTVPSADLQSNTVEVSQSSAELSPKPSTQASPSAPETTEMTVQVVESLTKVQLLIQDRQVVTALDKLADVPTTNQTAAEVESILRQVVQQAEAYYHQGLYKEATAVVRTMNQLFPNQPTTSQAMIASKEWQTQWYNNLATLKVAQEALDRHQYDGAIAEAKKVGYPGLKTEVDTIIAAAIDGKQAKNDASRQQNNRINPVSTPPSGSPAPRATPTPRPTLQPRAVPATPSRSAPSSTPSYYSPDPL